MSIELIGAVLGILAPILGYFIKRWIDGQHKKDLEKIVEDKNKVEQEKAKLEWNEATKKVNEAIKKQKEQLEKLEKGDV